ncbi:type II secretion system F family protein [Mycobacterium sp. PSTR-4-N]|uniref:type II secretion system F family protein n=1 Tax=Mycobacterium sp. PSTR-4-N TaxID=2917745 RepID=UPI001F14F483|nr:type II secretion system F family protein [Mycobacterium sp. PSTR-4-N]MCG7594460.1 type II secretion system F family protein [Mycobacterium sp. PSTR-4-N]
MTVAVVALALALLAWAPTTRAPARPTAARPRRRPPTLLVALLAGTVSACILPLTLVLAAATMVTVVAVRHRCRARRRVGIDEANALHGALEVLVSELRVGAHPVAAIDTAAREIAGPVGTSFAAVAARAVLGADVVAGLRAESHRSLVPGHWERLAVCWQLAARHGLAIASLMQAAQRDLAERERFRSRVDAGMAGARTTGTLLAGLPVLGVLLGCAIGADPLGFLMSGGIGGWLMCIGTALIGAGLLWSDRITASVLI